MKIIASISLLISIIFSNFQPFIPLTYSVNDKLAKIEDNSKNNTVVQVPVVEEDKNSIMKSAITIDLEGYCTIDIPGDLFIINESNSDSTYKQLVYIDNKTVINMSYVINMDNNVDIPGYITNVASETNTTTNNKTVETYNNIEWTRIESVNKEDDCKVYVWFTLNSNKTSAMWLKAKISDTTNESDMLNIIHEILSTYKIYDENDTVFKTPTTGMYKNYKDDDSNDEYKLNNSDNTVFKTSNGFVSDADISDNWEDLEIIIDGNKYKLPSTMAEFEKNGFYVNDAEKKIRNNNVLINQASKEEIKIENKNGTVIIAEFTNSNAYENLDIHDCSITSITIDKSTFYNKSITVEKENKSDSSDSNTNETDTDDTYTDENDIDNTDETKDNSEDADDNSEDEIEDESEDNDATSENEDSNSKTKYASYKDEFNYVDEEGGYAYVDGVKISLEEIATYESVDEDYKFLEPYINKNNTEETEKTETEETEGSNDNNKKHIEAADSYNHEIILAKGVTWGVYKDDLINVYGPCKESNSTLTWQSGDRTMTIRLNGVSNIEYVKLSAYKDKSRK